MSLAQEPETARPADDPTQLVWSLPPGSAAWGDEDGTTLVCRQVQTITADVKTFLFEPDRPALFHHEPGQFVTLLLEIDGRPVSRCYTIATPPTRPRLLGITVKRQPGGLVSNWLHDTVVPGTKINADGPYGIFTLTPHPSAKYLFLSGGSGITPLMSMTRTLYDLGSDIDVTFVHSARTPADIIFRRELDAIAATAAATRVVHVCERDAPQEPWGGHRGFVTTPMLQLIAPDLHERTVFCCGPKPYMAAVRQMLGEVGFDMSRYHEETFTFEDLAVDELAHPTTESLVEEELRLDDEPAVAPVPTYAVEFVRSGRTITCKADEFVLDAAYDAGINHQSSCTQGMCGTCKTTLLSGDVDMNHQGGIRPREIAQGKVLICCSKPLSDLTIDA